MWQGVYLGLASGVVILFVREFNPFTLDILGPAPEVRALAVGYVDIRMLSAPFFIIHYYYSNFYRGIGNTLTPMKVAIVANIVNIVIDYLLIFGKGPFPTLGVVGAAWATFTANIISATILAIVALSRPYRMRFDTHRWRPPDPAVIMRVLRVGLPIGLHYALDIGSFLVFSAYVGRMGTEQLAANQIIIQVLALSFMPCNGFAVAATTLMGQYIGAGMPDMAKRTAYQALRLGMLFTGLVALGYVLFSGPLVRLFNNDPMVVWYGKRIILLAAVFQVFDGLQIIVSGSLRGAGDTKVPMMLILGGGWIVFLPLAYVFGTVADGGVIGAWVGATIYVVVLGVGMLLRLKMDRWRRIRLEGVCP
jgi:MATE family multidrug resistance protein